MPSTRRVFVVTTVSAYDGLTESGSFLWWPVGQLEEVLSYYTRTAHSAREVLHEIGGDALRVRTLQLDVPVELDPEGVTIHLDDVLGVDTYDCPLPAVVEFDWVEQPYRTITVVVRSNDRNDVMHSLARNDHVLFAASDGGVSAEALRLGAEPLGWEDNYQETCLPHRNYCDGFCTHVGHVNACSLYPDPANPYDVAAAPAPTPTTVASPTASTETVEV